MCVCVEIRWTFDSSTCVSYKNGIRLSIFRTYINFDTGPFHSWRLRDSALRKRSDVFIYLKCFRESGFFINDFLMSLQIDFWCQNRRQWKDLSVDNCSKCHIGIFILIGNNCTFRKRKRILHSFILTFASISLLNFVSCRNWTRALIICNLSYCWIEDMCGLS